MHVWLRWVDTLSRGARASAYLVLIALPILVSSCTTATDVGPQMPQVRVDPVNLAGEPVGVDNLSPDLRKIGECILSILKSTSGVRDARLRALRNRIRVFAIVGFDIVDQSGTFWTVEFALWDPDYQDMDAIYDEAYALGLAVSDKILLQDDIETTWKTQCNASGFLQTGPVLGPDR